MEFVKKESKDGIELAIKVAKSDVQDVLNKTAVKINTANPIAGFRPGKAPYSMIANKYGEMTIIHEAADEIVSTTLNKILRDENIRPYGNVDFDLKPVSGPEWIMEYTAKFLAMPAVKLGDWQSKKIKKNAIVVPKEELDQALVELTKMSAVETEVERPIKKGDKAIIDLEVLVDGKIIDDGVINDFPVTIGEGKMIPGFEDNLLNHNKADAFEFNLTFPAAYGEPTLAGKPALFKAIVKKVLEMVAPILDDELAKKLGVESAEALKTSLEENLAQDKLTQEERRLETEGVKQLVATAEIADIPDKIIEDSALDIMADFEHNLAHQRLTMQQYLLSTKKTPDQLKAEMRPAAIERIKSTLVLNKLAQDENMDVMDKEIDQELQAERTYYAQDQKILSDISKPEYRNHLYRSLLNRKLMKLIKSKIVES